MLAAAWAVKDQVAALGLSGRNVATGVVLITGEPRDQHADPGEGIPHQT
ncbi:Uncharacterised protein [Mycobacterium tuberculosis]|uniref:Uncharacterized protein n=1 Tax=Mycobacterium tuberculosis TaxID=1773 RepID=A0A655AVE3_MYCTX|nr:Uncharacterised protein [Mycobacterium tuberculosis]